MHFRGENVDAGRILKAATHMLRILHGVEREMTGKKAVIEWHIDIMSTKEDAIIKLTAMGGTTSQRVAWDAAETAMVMFKGLKSRAVPEARIAK